MSPKGKVPSLLSGSSGACKIVDAQRRRTCKRCRGDILKDTRCIEVSKPGKMGHKTYCHGCFAEILEKTQSDLAKLRAELDRQEE